MNELHEYWYTQLEKITGCDFYNASLKAKNLCVNSIASILHCRLRPTERPIIESFAFHCIQEEIGPLLMDLRRASYPPKDVFDDLKLYDINMMIKVAEFFQIDFIESILKEALRLHTKDVE